MPLLSVNHLTVYRYRRPVRFGEHQLTFRQRDSYDQRLFDVSLRVSPKPQSIRWTHDVFGNCVAHVSMSEMAKELRFETSIRLDHTPQAVPAPALGILFLNHFSFWSRTNKGVLASSREPA